MKATKIVMAGMLLLAACTPAAIPTPTALPTATPTQEPTEVVTAVPTVEPTAEPTPTEVVIEIDDTESQAWWLGYWEEAEKVAAKIEGCEISYEIVNARELGYVNLIPWTVDQNGETVLGVIPDFCGTGSYWAIGLREDYPWHVDHILGDDFMSYVLGPQFMAYGYEPSYVRYVGIGQNYLGGLTQTELDELRTAFGSKPPVMIEEAGLDFIELLVRNRFGRTQ